MEKKLSEMSLEELWKLFPIYLTEHQPYWKEWYTDEESFLKNRVPKIERISHIGSTAINSIYAKPIIDILVEISKDYCLSDYKEVIVKSGYTCMSETSDRLSFNKGYTEEGFAERVFHLHLRYIGDNDELYFRFSTVWHNHLRNKHLTEHLRNNSNELATVRFSAFCGAMLSNNSFLMQR